MCHRQHFVIFTVLIILIAFLGCTIDKQQPVLESTLDDKEENSPSEPAAGLKPTAAPGTTSFDEIIKAITPEGYELTRLIREDIDNDGNFELIVSFGEKNDPYDDPYMSKYIKNYVLKKTEEKYINLGELKDNIGQIIDLKVIKLDTTGKKYIFATQTNEMNGIGCLIYSIVNNQIITVDNRFPATGRGVRTLIDDGDGIYKAVDYRVYQDVQNHRLTIYYKWDGISFIFDRKEITYLFLASINSCSAELNFWSTPFPLMGFHG